MMVTLVNEPQYKRLCAAIGREDLASDPRFADFARRGRMPVDALIPQLREVFLTLPTGCLAGPPARRRPHCRTDPQSRRMACATPMSSDTGGGVPGDTGGRAGILAAGRPGIASFSEDHFAPLA
jgi:hypothetical protein